MEEDDESDHPSELDAQKLEAELAAAKKELEELKQKFQEKLEELRNLIDVEDDEERSKIAQSDEYQELMKEIDSEKPKKNSRIWCSEKIYFLTEVKMEEKAFLRHYR